MGSYNFVLAAVIAVAIFACTSCRADLISDVCAESRQNSMCLVALRSDPRSKTSPLTYRLLTEIAVDKAISQSKSAADVARKVENQKNKGCASHLDVAHGKMEEAKGSLKAMKNETNREFVDLKVSQASAESYLCSISIPNVPKMLELKMLNEVFMNLTYLIHFIIYKIKFV